jgi:spore germination protein GerM
MAKKRKKKNLAGKFIVLLFLMGVLALMFYVFRQEIIHPLRPWLEKWSLAEKKREVLLYFSDREGEYLMGEKREIIKKNQVKEEARETISELIKGPKGKLIPTLPPGTKLLTLQINDVGVANVNFNSILSKAHPGGSTAEMMTVYSIVNSLSINFPQIKRVQILIDGKPIESIAGHLSLKKPIPPKLDLIKRQ